MIVRFQSREGPPQKLKAVEASDGTVSESWTEGLVARLTAEVVDESLLVIARQYGGFDTKERPDLLAIDEDGNLVVIELKRAATEDAITQALRYAAYCSQFDSEGIVRIYGSSLESNQIQAVEDDLDAREGLIRFLGTSGGTLENLNRLQRVILVAMEYDPPGFGDRRLVNKKPATVEVYTTQHLQGDR